MRQDSPKPGIAELMRGQTAGRKWAAETAKTAEVWRVDALRYAIGQWEFEEERHEIHGIELPVFMSSRHSDLATLGPSLFAGEAALKAANDKVTNDYMRGFAAGALSEWADVSPTE